MNSCIDFFTLSRYQDGVLPEAEASVVQDHLSRCPACQQQARQRAAFERSLAVAATLVDKPVTGACPDSSTLASYAEGRLAESSRHRVASHLAECDSCLSGLAALAREQQDLTAEQTEIEVPEWALERARSMVSQPVTDPAFQPLNQPSGKASDGWLGLVDRWLQPLRVAPGFGLAAVASFVLVAVLLVPSVNQDVGQEVGSPALERGSDSASSSAVELISPDADQLLASGELALSWKPATDASSYTVTVIDATGAFFREYTVAGTSLRLPAADGWSPGTRYTWWVTALQNDGSHLSSAHQTFLLSGSQAGSLSGSQAGNRSGNLSGSQPESSQP